MTTSKNPAKDIVMTDRTLKIGTRGSPLALKQTNMVVDALKAVHPSLAIETVIIRTSGDWKPEDGEKRLSEAQGGKGMFAVEIEKALLDKSIDCAVHSLKDMSSFLPEGLVIDHVLEREDPRDAFISFSAKHFLFLPQGATVGTSSHRRQAFILSRRPDLKVVPLRGNVHTRLEKLKDGQVDATFLAMAGLNRLGITGEFIHPMDYEDMMPSCGQGIVGIERREDDDRVKKLLDPIHHEQTGLCAAIERAALQVLDGSCHTPIGAFARQSGQMMRFDLKVSSMDGKRFYAQSGLSYINSIFDAAEFGGNIAVNLKENIPDDIFS